MNASRCFHSLHRAALAGMAWLFCAMAWPYSLTVALEEADNRPFEYIDESGQLTGFHIELVRQVSKALGWDTEFRRVPWKRAQLMLETGEVAAVTYIGATPEREGFAWFLPGNQLQVMRVGLYVRQSRADEIHYQPPLDDMVKRWRFGAAFGYGYNDEINALLQSSAPIDQTARTQGHLFKMLLSNRFDVAIAVLGALDQARHDLPDIDRQVHRLDGALFSGKPAYIAFSHKPPQSEAAARDFAREYARLRGSPAYRELVARFHVADSLPTEFAPK
jgi:polar amino acid transport system substrate-binding protein